MQELLKKDLQAKIFTIRRIQVMIDRDLADLYKVEVKRLNEQVKRNIERFPENFRFQLNNKEKIELVAICDRFESWKHSGNNPFVFTEQGVAMLSAVLRSEVAVHMSIQIINAFVEMRKIINRNSGLIQRIEGVERKLIESDQKFENLFSALEKNLLPTQGVFFDGQIFDAYELMSRIIRSAKQEIILIDNYIDESVLSQLSKRRANVEAIIYTKSVSRILQLDIERHNSQYPLIQIRELRDSHDRFLIIDRKESYHIGASLKDLGKKWFAFSKLDGKMLEFVLSKLHED
ncbi:MAG: ORF6N domain-containing protein [Flavobacteriales bacterium]|nr:ORF6N domain-containing protein [Crocinitomicaceae bacterium]NBX80243.1 ORF6N domain-containing protein [Flavobacteriales bacterium]NCA20705.1 ORF6N domain-containing protein [Crocinitomicaceae bacterium]